MVRELILASRSPRRRQLLEMLGIPLQVRPADIPETTRPHETPVEYAEIPEPLSNEVTFPAWEPGRMTIRIAPPPVEDAYLLVAENWYPDWKATADGAPVPVFRGNQTLITVPVAAGVSEVELRFDSKPYRIGKAVTLITLIIALAAIVTPVILRRKASD